MSVAVNDKGNFVLKRAATGAGETRKLPASWDEYTDLSELSDRALNKMTWTVPRIKQLMKTNKELTSKDGEYYLGERRILVQGEDVDKILTEEYKAVPGNVGYKRWYSLLQRDYVGMPRSQVEAFLANQVIKQRYRELKKRSNSRVTKPTAPSAKWILDYGKLGNTEGYWKSKKWIGIALFVDSFSKYVFCVPVQSESAEETVEVVDQWLEHLKAIKAPKPRAIGTDRGSNFTSEEFREHLEKNNIKHILSAAWTPTSQGQAERSQRVVKGYLVAYADAAGKPNSWPSFVEQTCAVINTSWQRLLGTKTTPYEALTGQPDPRLKDRLAKEAEDRRNTRFYVRQAIKPGTAVRLSLRVVGDSKTKGALKSETRKGYLDNWDGDTIYVVRQRKGNFYTLETTDGEKVQGSYDRSDVLPIPSKEPKDAHRKSEVVEEEQPPKAVKIRIRQSKPEKPPKARYEGEDADLIDTVFQENPPKGYTYKVVAIGTERGERVAYYRRQLTGGKLKGPRLYQTIGEIRSYKQITR